MDTLGFLLSKSSVLPPIEAKKYQKKLMEDASAFRQDSAFDDDDYDPADRYLLKFKHNWLILSRLMC